MAPYMMVMIGMVLVWDVTKCVARPADIDKWADESNYDRRSDEYELNAIDTEPAGLYGGKATGKSGWKAVFRLAEIVRLSKKFEQVLRKEADEIAAEPAPNPAEDSVLRPEQESDPSKASPPMYGPERIIDQLHEQTGEKQPIYHSALDGWIF